jgi:uncharacterized protein YjeT (DUF2065 family)
VSAQVLKFRKPATRRTESKRTGGLRVTGFAVALESRAGLVLFTADGIQLGLTPEQARELAADLIDLADDAADSAPMLPDADPYDSVMLEALREAVDESLGWDSERERDNGDYAARVRAFGLKHGKGPF